MVQSFPRSAILAMALALSACGGFKGQPEPAPTPAIPAEPTKPALAGVLLGPLGQKLDEADREKAFDTQMMALDSGQRRTWKGGRGTFGFVEIGPESSRAEGLCRSYVHKIYFSGRPQSGEGLACRQPSGGWKIVS